MVCWRWTMASLQWRFSYINEVLLTLVPTDAFERIIQLLRGIYHYARELFRLHCNGPSLLTFLPFAHSYPVARSVNWFVLNMNKWNIGISFKSKFSNTLVLITLMYCKYFTLSICSVAEYASSAISSWFFFDEIAANVAQRIWSCPLANQKQSAYISILNSNDKLLEKYLHSTAQGQSLCPQIIIDQFMQCFTKHINLNGIQHARAFESHNWTLEIFQNNIFPQVTGNKFGAIWFNSMNSNWIQPKFLTWYLM